MKYIYCQLLALIKEEYCMEDILWELQPDEESVKNYCWNAEFKKEDVFDEDDQNG